MGYRICNICIYNIYIYKYYDLGWPDNGVYPQVLVMVMEKNDD